MKGMNFKKYCELLKAEAIEFKEDFEWDNDQWNDSYVEFKETIANDKPEWLKKFTPEQLAVNFAREFYATANMNTHTYWPVDKDGVWYKASVTKPPDCLGVLVYIPEEDDHITAGMWDVSDKWVLLDGYRKPTSQVTYWTWAPELPEDLEYEPTEEDEEADFINSEAKLVEIGFEHNAQSNANFTEYRKIVNGVTWAYVTRSAGNDYLTKDAEFVCHVETWPLLNEALDEYNLRD